MACSVELLAEVDREIDKVDAQHSKRILKFLHARVAKLDDPRSIGEALHGSGLGSSGNIAWAITGSSVRSKTIVWRFCSSASEIAKESIASALPETVLVIQLLKKTPAARRWRTVEQGRHNRAAS